MIFDKTPSDWRQLEELVALTFEAMGCNAIVDMIIPKVEELRDQLTGIREMARGSGDDAPRPAAGALNEWCQAAFQTAQEIREELGRTLTPLLIEDVKRLIDGIEICENEPDCLE